MAAEPRRVCSVLTINQALLLGHKLHVGLGKTYFKKLYLPKIISRNKPKPFFFFFKISKPHLCKQNTLQIVKQKADKSLPIPFPALTNTINTSTGQQGENLPGRSLLFWAALTECLPAANRRDSATTTRQDKHPGKQQRGSSHAACRTFSNRHQTSIRRWVLGAEGQPNPAW